MTKSELLKKAAEMAEVSQKEVDTVIGALSDIIMEVIANNDSVKFGEICTFKGIDKPARSCRNPKTGETINVPAKSGQPKAVFTKKCKE